MFYSLKGINPMEIVIASQTHVNYCHHHFTAKGKQKLGNG